MAAARVRQAEKLRVLTSEAYQNLIRKSNLGRENQAIAELSLLQGLPQVEVAAELEVFHGIRMDRSTVSRRLREVILPRLLEIAELEK